uniref:C-type lectin domain-containing protein n=1 Tax=Panagrolaimus superbus TaxID=310955 RepID=A0A914Z3Y1_9BILA
MLHLSSVIWLFSLFVLINSLCDRRTPRKEGYLREPCVPGFYEGSCLIILEKMKLHEAMEKCRYDYGGRLATAPSKDAFKVWARTIHFSTKKSITEKSRFWVGYDKSGFKNVIPGGEDSTFDEKRWKDVFNADKFVKIDDWENDENKNQLGNFDCPPEGTIFNPLNHKFDVEGYNRKFHGLCETVRSAKLQCDSGWYLIPPLRMCVKVHRDKIIFLQAHAKCNSEDSFIATAQNIYELKLLRNVIVPLKITNNLRSIGGFWGGLKSEGRTTYSMDGTNPIFSVNTDDNKKKCGAFTYRNFGHDELVGVAVPCNEGGFWDTTYKLPFMCQRFADQSNGGGT